MIFFSEFNLEYDLELDCRNDFMEMNDGENEYSPFFGRFCGKESDVEKSLFSIQTNLENLNNIPRILYSTQNKMWIRSVEQEVIQ